MVIATVAHPATRCVNTADRLTDQFSTDDDGTGADRSAVQVDQR